jgi:hypothetical protein
MKHGEPSDNRRLCSDPRTASACARRPVPGPARSAAGAFLTEHETAGLETPRALILKRHGRTHIRGHPDAGHLNGVDNKQDLRNIRRPNKAIND